MDPPATMLRSLPAEAVASAIGIKGTKKSRREIFWGLIRNQDIHAFFPPPSEQYLRIAYFLLKEEIMHDYQEWKFVETPTYLCNFRVHVNNYFITSRGEPVYMRVQAHGHEKILASWPSEEDWITCQILCRARNSSVCHFLAWAGPHTRPVYTPIQVSELGLGEIENAVESLWKSNVIPLKAPHQALKLNSLQAYRIFAAACVNGSQFCVNMPHAQLDYSRCTLKRTHDIYLSQPHEETTAVSLIIIPEIYDPTDEYSSSTITTLPDIFPLPDELLSLPPKKRIFSDENL